MLERFFQVKYYISIWVETPLEDCQMDVKPIIHLCPCRIYPRALPMMQYQSCIERQITLLE